MERVHILIDEDSPEYVRARRLGARRTTQRLKQGTDIKDITPTPLKPGDDVNAWYGFMDGFKAAVRKFDPNSTPVRSKEYVLWKRRASNIATRQLNRGVAKEKIVVKFPDDPTRDCIRGIDAGIAQAVEKFNHAKVVKHRFRKRKYKVRTKLPPIPEKTGIEKMRFEGLTPEALRKKGHFYGTFVVTRQLKRGVPEDKIKLDVPEGGGIPKEFRDACLAGKTEAILRFNNPKPKGAKRGRKKKAAPVVETPPVDPNAEPTLVSETPSRLRGRLDGKRLTAGRLKKGTLSDDIKFRIPSGSDDDYRRGIEEGKQEAIEEFNNPKEKEAKPPREQKPIKPQLPYDPKSKSYQEGFDDMKRAALEILRGGENLDEYDLRPAGNNVKASYMYGGRAGVEAAKIEYQKEQAAKNTPTHKMELAGASIGYNPNNDKFKEGFADGKKDAEGLFANGNTPDDFELPLWEGDCDPHEYCGYILGIREAVAAFEQKRATAERARQIAEQKAIQTFDPNSEDYKSGHDSSYRVALSALHKGTKPEMIRVPSLATLGGNSNKYNGILRGIADAKAEFAKEKQNATNAADAAEQARANTFNSAQDTQKHHRR